MSENFTEDGLPPHGIPPNVISIGDGHAIVYAEYRGEPAGVTEWHRKSDGTWCTGWVAFNGVAWAREFRGNPNFQVWDVLKQEPLTLMPSILCRICGNHGFITNGRWVKA